jgi:hypothetical protein
MWVHFESFHINVLPTYQSMYPPAQGMALAIGQKLTGVPWIGIVLSTALMCGAIYWMLLGWLPAPWALLGAAFVCARFGIFSYWTNSYYGGSVPALGGALILGALPRFESKPKVQTALIFAGGLLILANSRPLEGFLFSIPLVLAFVVMLVKGIRSGKITWGVAVKILSPAMVLLVLGVAWMSYYNWRGTGNPLLMPYQVNFQAYHISKPFPLQKPNPIPQYRHQSMKTFYIFYDYLNYLRYKDNILDYITRKISVYYGFFIWPISLLIVPGVYVMWRGKMRAVLLSLAVLVSAMLVQVWPANPHYGAPATGAVLLVLLCGVRYFRNSQLKYGVWGSRALAIVLALAVISPIAQAMLDPFELGLSFNSASNTYPMPAFIQRVRIQSELSARSAKQLVIVNYRHREMASHDWVYNNADIDDAHTVWARDMGYLRNKELLKYYPDRQVSYTTLGDAASLILPYDQVMAPMRLAYGDAAPQTASPMLAGVDQHISPSIAKSIPAGPAENSAPRSR